MGRRRRRWETTGRSLIRWKRFGNNPGGTLGNLSPNSTPRGSLELPGCEVELRGTLGRVLVRRRLRSSPDPISEEEFPVRTPLTRERDARYRKGRQAAIAPQKRRGTSLLIPRHSAHFGLRQKPAHATADIETGHRSTSATLLQILR